MGQELLERKIGFELTPSRQCWSLVGALIFSLTQVAGARAQEPGIAGQLPLETSRVSIAPNRPTLKLGSQGETVSELQAALKLLGFYGGSVDGIYGRETAGAVSQFQKAAGLTSDGIAGPVTWKSLFPPAPADNTQTGSPGPSNPSASGGSSTPTPGNQPPSPEPARTTPPRQTTPPSPERVKPAVPEPVALPTLRRGMRGPAVAHLQERLKAIGVYDGPVDGVFGPQTEAAVKTAQRNKNLNPDGVVGPVTWSAILR